MRRCCLCAIAECAPERTTVCSEFVGLQILPVYRTHRARASMLVVSSFMEHQNFGCRTGSAASYIISERIFGYGSSCRSGTVGRRVGEQAKELVSIISCYHARRSLSPPTRACCSCVRAGRNCPRTCKRFIERLPPKGHAIARNSHEEVQEV
jgi:hypothetical protein